MHKRHWLMLVPSVFLTATLLSCALQGDYPAPALGVLVDRNLTVVAVLPDGAGERAGVQVGDVLTITRRSSRGMAV